MDSDELRTQFEKAFSELLLSYKIDAQPSISKDKSKYFEELMLVNKVLQTLTVKGRKPSLLDVGGGAGNFCVLCKYVFDLDIFMVDRMDEFDPQLNRVMGAITDVEARMKQFGIIFEKSDPVNENFFSDQQFDVIVNFDVIEHLPCGVPHFLEKLHKRLSKGGHLIVSTPNQCHLFNRLKAVAGINTWEDFNYYITTDVFFGHIRELTFDEFAKILKPIGFFWLEGHTHLLNPYGKIRLRPHFIKRLAKFILDRSFPTLSYQLFAVLRK